MPNPVAPPAWRVDQRFWLRHLLLPLLFIAALLAVLELSSMDLWLADRWYALEGGQWAWRNHWLSYDLIHHHGKQLIIGIGALALLSAILSYHIPRWRPWRAPSLYLLTAMTVVPAAIAGFKRLSPVSCPWDLSRYGGSLPYIRTFEHSFGPTGLGHCFPSGHASGGFILLAIYFAALPFVQRPARFLLPGLVVGWIFALGQQSRGAHFLSHDVWSLCICWLGALGLFLMFRPQHWYQPPLESPDA